jgi:hypothetical protein
MRRNMLKHSAIDVQDNRYDHGAGDETYQRDDAGSHMWPPAAIAGPRQRAPGWLRVALILSSLAAPITKAVS